MKKYITKKLIARCLGRGQQLLETKGWTQGCMAKDSMGCPVSVGADASCFCASGAVARAASEIFPGNELLQCRLRGRTESVLINVIPVETYRKAGNLTGYNDCRLHSARAAINWFKAARAAMVDE